MPKPNKSSASSATRKKQAAKKADKTGGPPGASSSNNTGTKLQRGQKKLSKAEKKAIKNDPKQKVFVPPPKPPAPAIPDPLDSEGLARTLPAELVVVLRRLGKKDGVTRRKGLEELKESWVDPVVAKAKSAKPAEEEDIDIEGEGMEDSLLEALPVWVSANGHNLRDLLRISAMLNFSRLYSCTTCLVCSCHQAIAVSLSPSTPPCYLSPRSQTHCGIPWL